MNVNTLINDTDLNVEIAELRDHIKNPNHVVSDIIDDADNQYVDLVMEGGGMLGIALVGYTWALEQMGIRFLGLGGTSAGSINALLLAGLDTSDQAKSPQVLRELGTKDFFDFVDGGSIVERLIRIGLSKGKRLKKTRVAFLLPLVKRRLCKHYGLNPGTAFLEWLSDLLSNAGIQTLQDLNARMAQRPAGLRERGKAPFAANDGPQARLEIIAADITTETRAAFPRMAGLYWQNPLKQSPAQFVRASMSIPFFFEPLRVGALPQGPAAQQLWKTLAGYDVTLNPNTAIPDTAMFVDGGIVSNFPIDTFHVSGKKPRMPTFGVKLEYDQRAKSASALPISSKGKINDLLPLVGAIFNSARHVLDYEFIKKNPDFRHLVQFIPCTYTDSDGALQTYDWLDFDLPDPHKVGLFKQGAEKAIEFVRTFSSPVDDQGMPAPANSAAYTSKWRFYQNECR